MSALDPILRIVERLSSRVDGKPELRWAVVTQLSPLRIRLDADEQDLLATPDTLVSPLLPGERVRVALQNRRVTVLGVAGRRTDLRGTTAQRVALASSGAAVRGMRFYDTDTNREYVWDGTQWQIVKRVEKRSATFSLAASVATASGWYYQDFTPVSFLSAFPTKPHVEVTFEFEWGAVQYGQVTSVTASQILSRGVRLGAQPATGIMHYTATES